jgi:phenylacetate-CoA ligase
VEDIVVTPDGRHAGRLDHVFKDSANIREAQLIQETVDTLTIRIVRRPGYGEADSEQVLRALRERLGDRMRFEFEFVEHIPRGANGKFRFVVSKVGLRLGNEASRHSGVQALR